VAFSISRALEDELRMGGSALLAGMIHGTERARDSAFAAPDDTRRGLIDERILQPGGEIR
jgi:hypothetical protein